MAGAECWCNGREAWRDFLMECVGIFNVRQFLAHSQPRSKLEMRPRLTYTQRVQRVLCTVHNPLNVSEAATMSSNTAFSDWVGDTQLSIPCQPCYP